MVSEPPGDPTWRYLRSIWPDNLGNRPIGQWLWSKFSGIEWKTVHALIHDYYSRSPANTRFVVFSTYHHPSPRVQPEIVRLLQLQCMMSGYWTAVVMDFPKVSKRQRGPKRGITHRIHQMGVFIWLIFYGKCGETYNRAMDPMGNSLLFPNPPKWLSFN